jgi:prepilin-type N-terminal cleavage/methylation domain-containing protein/prepilin-type processing-associated H-X9-DG protein
MKTQERRGFTLIELLVVIAIIGILAGMVFPVFARARASARKAVCLSNVKNLALAIQMYLADNNDTLAPTEHRQEVHDFFDAVRSRDGCEHAASATPYLSWPVILDEYVKNRDVWRCPSARLRGGAATIVPNYYPGGWLGAWEVHLGDWGPGTDHAYGPCYDTTMPTGWGGTVTDSFLQGELAVPRLPRENSALNAFVRGYSLPGTSDELKLVEVADPVRYCIVADGGYSPELNRGMLAYPDFCYTGCSCCATFEDLACNWGCTTTIDMVLDPAGLKGKGRHLDGSNLGFLDGHAAWYRAEFLRNDAPRALEPGGSNGCPYAAETTEAECEIQGVPGSAPESCVDGSRPSDWGFECAGWP